MGTAGQAARADDALRYPGSVAGLMRRGPLLAPVMVLAATLLVVLVADGLTVAQAGGGGGSAGSTGGLKPKTIAEFNEPVYVTTAPGKANQKLMFVVEQRGVVKLVSGNQKLKRPFLDLREQVRSGGEQGLYSIAFDPDYTANRRLYAIFADRSGDLRISQYRRSKNSNRLAKARERPVLKIPHPDAEIHYGGTIAFGPDGHLYASTGDGGSACDPTGNAQSAESLLGKLLRVDPEAGGGYSIPADNPGIDPSNPAASHEIYALGLRNPFRFSIDPESSTIAIGDVGQNSSEEINLMSLDAARGANFGWAAFEGSEPLNREIGCLGAVIPTPAPDRHDPPLHEYPHEGEGQSGCAVTGGVVVRNPKLPSLDGRYVYSDFCDGGLRSLDPDPAAPLDERGTGLNIGIPTSIAGTPAGRLYSTSINGELFRIKAAA